MIYVVTGYRRSGTSIMMKCLQEGGIPAILRPDFENQNKKTEEYDPNPGELMEVGQPYYKSPRFLRLLAAQRENSCVKIFYDGLPYLPSGDWTIIWMHRDEEEIVRSCEKVDKHLKSLGNHKNPKLWEVWDVFRPYDQTSMDHVLGMCKQRLDMNVIEVDFKSVIERPLDVFDELRDVRGLPINPEKAAAKVNPDYYRVRQVVPEVGT